MRPGSLIRQYVSGNKDESNSATEVYFQIGPDEGIDWLHLSLLKQMIARPFYSELRTKQQLGYIVQCSVGEAEGVRGLSFAVQSTVLRPPELEARIDAFLSEYRRGPLAAMTSAEFEGYRNAAVAQILDVDLRLDAQASRLWSECARRRYDFGRPWTSAKRMREETTLEGVRSLFDASIASNGQRVRRLATHVFAPKDAPSVLRLDALGDDYYPPEPDRLADVQYVQQSMQQ